MHRPLTIRLTKDESACFEQATHVLGTELSKLVQAAVTEAALKLGFDSATTAAPPAPSFAWPDAPVRSTTASERVTVSLDALTSGLLDRASEHVEQSRPKFIVGATLRYLANLSRKDSAPHHLATLPLPPEYLSPRS